MTTKTITPKQKESLLKFFNTPFEKTKMHSTLTKTMLILILSLIGTLFYTIWGSTSLGIKLMLTEFLVLVVVCVVHWILEESYKGLWSSYIREYPEVWKEFENSLMQKVKDHRDKQVSKYQTKLEELQKKNNSN